MAGEPYKNESIVLIKDFEIFYNSRLKQRLHQMMKKTEFHEKFSPQFY